MKTIRAALNTYGNWNIYVGRVNVFKCGMQFDAVDRLSDMLATKEFKLSDKSEITQAHVDEHRAKLKGKNEEN